MRRLLHLGRLYYGLRDWLELILPQLRKLIRHRGLIIPRLITAKIGLSKCHLRFILSFAPVI